MRRLLRENAFTSKLSSENTSLIRPALDAVMKIQYFKVFFVPQTEHRIVLGAVFTMRRPRTIFAVCFFLPRGHWEYCARALEGYS